MAWQGTQTAADDAAAHDRITHYQCDHLGTPRELTDMQGNVVWNGRYKAWGRLLHVEREIEQPLRFQGQYEDQKTGLFYNRYRYYDPDVARYVTQDPIGLLGGINSYLYSASPTTMTDPLGLVCGKANPSKVDKDGNGRFRDQYGRFAADPGWPANRGFNDIPNKFSLLPMTNIDRFGYPGGTFVSPQGVKFSHRALPQSYQNGKPYHVYQVLKPIQVDAGLAAPWFNQVGMGMQYELPLPVDDLIKNGSLIEILPCGPIP